MEVHHHSHTSRKKWTHYFWEFLMLFLAVFCGFLAENQREHYMEHQREKKYAAQLYKDLKFDTLVFFDLTNKMNKELKLYDSASLLFQKQVSLTDDEFVRLSRRMLKAYNLANISTTFNQMKSSGSLRYIRNAELARQLSGYYDTHIPMLMTSFEYINEKLHTQLEPFFAKHFDLSVTQFYVDINNELSLPPDLRYYDRSESSDLLIKNYFKLYYNGVLYIRDYPIKYSKERATRLIKQLEEEYHLK